MNTLQIENLTPTVRRILRLAEIEASKDKSFTGINHVLTGIMLEGDNCASSILKASGFTVEGVRKLQLPSNK